MINQNNISLNLANQESIEAFRAKWNDKAVWQVSEEIFRDFARQQIAEYLNQKLPEIITSVFCSNPAYRIGEAMKS